MQAYIQISLDGAREKEVFAALKKLPEVKELHILFGEWDMLCKVEVENTDALGTFVINNIRSLPGVRLTSTMIVAK